MLYFSFRKDGYYVKGMKCDIFHQLALGFLLYQLHTFSACSCACVWAREHSFSLQPCTAWSNRSAEGLKLSHILPLYVVGFLFVCLFVFVRCFVCLFVVLRTGLSFESHMEIMDELQHWLLQPLSWTKVQKPNRSQLRMVHAKDKKNLHLRYLNSILVLHLCIWIKRCWAQALELKCLLCSMVWTVCGNFCQELTSTLLQIKNWQFRSQHELHSAPMDIMEETILF